MCTFAYRSKKDTQGGGGGLLPEVLRGEEWEMCRRYGADRPRQRTLRLGRALYLFSGLLNEVTQVVLLNTFPISIICLLFLTNPRGEEREGGGEGCFHTAKHDKTECERVYAHTRAQQQHLPRAQTTGWVQPM